jgi:small subunit ribosomal protein S6
MAQLYESLFIVRPSLADDEVHKLLEKVKGTVEKAGGTVERLESLGKKKLAYEIKREKKGVFVQLHYRGPGVVVAELERSFRLDDAVMKYLTVKLDERRLRASENGPPTEPEYGWVQ